MRTWDGNAFNVLVSPHFCVRTMKRGKQLEATTRATGIAPSWLAGTTHRMMVRGSWRITVQNHGGYSVLCSEEIQSMIELLSSIPMVLKKVCLHTTGVLYRFYSAQLAPVSKGMCANISFSSKKKGAQVQKNMHHSFIYVEIHTSATCQDIPWTLCPWCSATSCLEWSFQCPPPGPNIGRHATWTEAGAPIAWSLPFKGTRVTPGLECDWVWGGS